jgi:alpha-1,3-rhamnosyl/mannosyltransferase
MPPLVLVDVTPVETDSGSRGIGRFVLDLLTGLARTCDEWRPALRLRFLVRLGRAPWWVALDDPGEALERMRRCRGRYDYRYRRRRRRWLGAASHLLGADLLHMTETAGMPWTSSVPRIVTCHDLIRLALPEDYLGAPPPLGALRYRVQWHRERRRYATARRIVAISERSRQDLERLLDIPPARIDVVHNGIDLARFTGAPSLGADREMLLGLGLGSQPYVLYVGGADPRKNVEAMMAALARARREVPLVLVWAGALSAEETTKAQRLARRHGVEEQVRYLGFVDDPALPVLYRRAVAHLFLSRLEGFGLTVVEAMASGCPVVVARGSASDEIAGDAGIVVHADDALGAGRWLVRLASDPGFRAEQGSRGLARAEAFGCEATARGYVASYRRALGGGDGGSRP